MLQGSLVVMAQEWTRPAVMLVNVRPPLTAAGTRLREIVPVPSWPWLLSPQQSACLSVVIPQVNDCVSLGKKLLPAQIWRQLRPPTTAVGLSRVATVPSPSSPWPFLPQQYPWWSVAMPQE